MTKSEESLARRITVVVPDDVESVRLDKYLAGHLEVNLSRSRVQKLIEEGQIVVNSQLVPGKHTVVAGEKVDILVPHRPPTVLLGEDIPLDIRYEDEYLAVVYKPAGMVTHPAAGNRNGTLVNGLIHHFRKLASSAGEDRPGIVHRLDKNTSGLLVIAREDNTYAALQQAIAERELKRTYLAVVCGHMGEDQGLIDLPIGRSTRDRTRMSVTGTSPRPAQTEYTVKEQFRLYDLLELSLHTGRTHQIRVHLAHLNHPVLGDPEYGGREKHYRSQFGPDRPLVKQLLQIISRQALHAVSLAFEHPVTGEAMHFEADLPDDFRNVLDCLRENEPSRA